MGNTCFTYVADGGVDAVSNNYYSNALPSHVLPTASSAAPVYISANHILMVPSAQSLSQRSAVSASGGGASVVARRRSGGSGCHNGLPQSLVHSPPLAVAAAATAASFRTLSNVNGSVERAARSNAPPAEAAAAVNRDDCELFEYVSKSRSAAAGPSTLPTPLRRKHHNPNYLLLQQQQQHLQNQSEQYCRLDRVTVTTPSRRHRS